MTFLVILFAIAASIWMIPLVRAGRLAPMAVSVLLLGTVVGPAFFAIDGPFQLSIDRVVWLIVVGTVAIRWRLGDCQMEKPTRLDWLVIAFACWLLCSAILGGPGTSTSKPIARWLFYIAMPVSMYGICRIVKIRESDLKWIINAILVLGLYLAVMAVFETRGLHWAVFPSYIVGTDSWEFFGRGRGPLLNPAGNGILMTFAIATAVFGFLKSDRRGKIFYGVAILVLLAGVYSTLTRSAWVGAAAALGVAAMIYAPRWLRVLGLSAAVLFAGAMVMGLKDQLLRMKRDKYLSAEDAEESVQLRPLLAIVAWEMIKDRPVTGHGFGNYRKHAHPYHEIRSYGLPLANARPYMQHNTVLSVLVDTGVIGLTLFFAILTMITSSAWQVVRDGNRSASCRTIGLIMLAGVSAYFVNGLFHDVIVIPMVHMFLFFMAGLTTTVCRRGVVAANSPPQPVRAGFAYQ